MSKFDGGPAFPREDYQINGCGGQEGMTLRDYFAAKALSAVVSAIMSQGSNCWKLVDFAQEAYGLADAMLAERAKRDGAALAAAGEPK